MICTCISETNFEKCQKALENCAMAEIRLDVTHFNNSQIAKLFSQSKAPLIATFRPTDISDTARHIALKAAIITGATYVDIEFDAPYATELITFAKENDCKIILSYHNFQATPSTKELKEIAQKMQALQPDFLKIVTFANASIDTLQVLPLYETTENLIAFCMGDHGKYSRIAAYYLKTPFIYAAPDNACTTADGQLTVSEIKSILSLLN